MAWTLAERFKFANDLAITGASAEEIENSAQITLGMAQIIWARAHPEVFDPFGGLKKNAKDEGHD